MYLTEKINRRVTKYDAQFCALVGREVTYESVAKLVREIIRPFGGFVCVVNEKGTLKSMFEMSGSYDHDRALPKRIVLNLHKPDDRETIVPTLKAIERLRHRFVQVLQHELIHKHQHACRDAEYVSHENVKRVKFQTRKKLTKKQSETITYLTEHDEIDAYGHDIAYEIKWRYPTVVPREVLRTIMRRRYVESMRFYTQGFAGLDWTAVRKLLLARVYKWLPYVTPLPELVLLDSAYVPT